MLAAQASREDRLAAADDVLDNDGTAEELRDKIAALDRFYRVIAATGD
jgi:dephospho-CoA kinase